ncbi:MAG: metallophosphoesterase, partial [Candidatus Altiarchaeota archaeon]|nr:metallophosphoesterase [Candidatus Altiarchaeota archaeon]
MVSIACISDCHLGYRHRFKTQRLFDFLNAFNDGVEKALAMNPDVIVFLGDIVHHSRPDPVTLRSVVKKLLEIASKKQVVMCIGNHEIEGHLSTTYTPIYSDIHENIHVLSTENPHVILDASGKKIGFHGFEFMRSRERAEETLYKVSGEKLDGEVNVLCLHQAVEGYLSPHEISVRTLRDVAPKYDLILLGHGHKRQRIKELDDITPAYYVGSTERISFNEAENPTGIAVFKDDLRNPSFISVTAAPMKNVKLRIESKDPAEVNSRIREALESNKHCKLLRIEVESDLSSMEFSH